jgi:hypothetical protein
VAKGAIAKEEIIKKILEVFPSSFIYDKEIRIPYVEEGENIQIKCALTCAKVNVEVGGENALPGENTSVATTSATVQPVEKTEISNEERDNLKRMMEALGI